MSKPFIMMFSKYGCLSRIMNVLWLLFFCAYFIAKRQKLNHVSVKKKMLHIYKNLLVVPLCLLMCLTTDA